MPTYRYFRVEGDPNDLGLLPEALRDLSNLDAIAEQAEADVLEHYTRSMPDRCGYATVLDAGTVVERYVWLRGYAVDPLDAIPSFATAFRREIANVIRWRAARDAKKPNVESESSGEPSTSKTYRADAEHRMPPDFGRSLRSFRIDQTPWVI